MNDQQGMTIMLIENDGACAAVIEDQLRRAGLSGAVLPFSTARAALEYLSTEGGPCDDRSAAPPVVLCDMDRNATENFEALGRLKASERTRCIPVIVITPSDDPAGAARCYDIGCNACIMRPRDDERFTQAIQILGRFLSIMKLSSKRKA
jgi:CheY-like chemotaxis protein